MSRKLFGWLMGKTEFTIPEQELRKQAAADGVTRLVIGVAIAKDGRLLIVRRIPDGFMGGNYELPGGGVDKQETILESIKRETLPGSTKRKLILDKYPIIY